MATISVLVLWSSVFSLQPQAPGRSASELRASIVASWPKKGAVIAEFANERSSSIADQKEVAYCFSSGAWFVIETNGVNASRGRTPEGVVWSVKADRGEIQEWKAPHDDSSRGVDLMFPAFGLVRALTDQPESLAGVEGLPDGGTRVTFRVPKGVRGLPIEVIPADDVAGWGGPQNILRPYVIDLDSRGWVVRTSSNNKPVELSHQEVCEGTGFQVSTRCPWPADMVVLSACRYDPSASPDMFSIESVKQRLLTRRKAVPMKRTPVVYDPAPGSVPPIPITTDGPSGTGWSQWAVAGAGATLIIIGGFAWLRRRS